MKPVHALLLVLAAVFCASASKHGHHHHHHHHDYYAKPKYHFKYGVDDPKHGDHHSQWEERDGDKVKGGYTVKEADGTWRKVSYTSDKENGFNAVVERHGKAVHPHGSHHGGGHHSGHHGHLKADIIVSPKGDTHESLESYPDGAYGYIG
ncbi:Cuticle protein 19 [Frankliniella fusca]|uniref:Cuticle protein 19 n=1 Tax=Frankliniella fusca TaxID=407009 RepID=A0AAE1H7H9_9NEOP|nr:Cuticle protein 19 [Frankliniella fusca]